MEIYRIDIWRSGAKAGFCLITPAPTLQHGIKQSKPLTTEKRTMLFPQLQISKAFIIIVGYSIAYSYVFVSDVCSLISAPALAVNP